MQTVLGLYLQLNGINMLTFDEPKMCHLNLHLESEKFRL